MEEGPYPVPFRTRQSSPPSPMVLRRKSVGEQDAAGLPAGDAPPLERRAKRRGAPLGAPRPFRFHGAGYD